MEDIWFEKIEEYLRGKMSSEEKADFDKELSTNQELLTVFKLYTAIDIEMSVNVKYKSEESKLKETLQALNKKYFTNDRKYNSKE